MSKEPEKQESVPKAVFGAVVNVACGAFLTLTVWHVGKRGLEKAKSWLER